MPSKNQIDIMNLFRKNLFLEISMMKIMKVLKSSSYQRIYESIKELENRNILVSKKVGNSNIISLSINPASILELSYLDEKEAFSKNIPNIEKILSFKEFLDDIVLITGSYASGKENSKSDIDLVIMTRDDVIKKQKLIENLTMLYIPKIHPIVISYQDFIEMLLGDIENYGKEIYKNRLLFRNTNRYYSLIMETIKNGFRN